MRAPPRPLQSVLANDEADALASKMRSIEYGTPSNNDALTVRFGIEQGVFEAVGLDLSVRTVFGGPQIAAALDSGEIPVGSLGSPSGIPAMAAGKQFRIVASGCRQHAHMFLGVGKSIRDYDALRGKRIGVLSIGSCPSWIVQRMLAHHGLDPQRDVTLVPLLSDYPRIIEFMVDGRIDACLATEPNLSIGEDRGVLDTWAAAYEERYLPRFQWIVRVANTRFLERDPEAVASVLHGCRLAAHHAAQNVDDFARFVAKYYGASEIAAGRAVERELPRYQLDCQLDMPGLQNSVDMLHELGGIARAMKAEDFAELRFQPGAGPVESMPG
jgi:NitT/TauT family transport system substrate-binding protein